MLRITLVSVLVALVAACAASVPEPASQTPASAEGEPVVVHLVIGGVT